MKKNFLILFAVCVLALLMTNTVSAQLYNRVSEKKIKLVKGTKLVLTGEVRDSDEVAYQFKARPTQTITVKLTGRDADFSFYVMYELDVHLIAENTQSWSGKLPSDFKGNCEIVVHSNYKVASYRLEILLK
jgi:hypothetical protein